MPADGKPKKAFIVSSNNWFSRMRGMRLAMLLWGGLGTGHRWYLLGGQSINLAMASTTAGSSASEGFGSFHLFHPTSILIPLGSRLFVFLFVCLGCFVLVLCVFLVLFLVGVCFHLDTRGFNLIQTHLIEMLLDDRQGFTARSAWRKKNTLVHTLTCAIVFIQSTKIRPEKTEHTNFSAT